MVAEEPGEALDVVDLQGLVGLEGHRATLLEDAATLSLEGAPVELPAGLTGDA